MPTFFFVYFTLSHMTLLSHGSHVQSHNGSPDLSHDEGTWSVTWPWTIFTSHMSHYDSLFCVSSILSLWLTLPNLWLPWELPHHWLILPHHTLQHDVTAYMYLPILSTPVVVYKSGILGTRSPRLDFTCDTVLVNWSLTRRNSLPHLFHLRHSPQRLSVLRYHLAYAWRRPMYTAESLQLGRDPQDCSLTVLGQGWTWYGWCTSYKGDVHLNCKTNDTKSH